MIVDASVVLKWRLLEADSRQAIQLFALPNLVAPTVLWIEIGQALTKQVRRRLITHDEAREIWRDLSNADLRIADSGALYAPALDLAFQLGASFYDCVYLALAIAEDDVLVTADERFVRAASAAPALRGRVLRLADAA